MFKSDLLCLLRRWKASGDEILMMGDFNENVYSGAISTALAGGDLHMTEICYWTTGKHLPPTHSCGSTPIDAIFGTAGLVCSAALLLPCNVGVGDHRVFIVDITSELILGNVFPCVIPASRRLLNCKSDKIKNSYIAVLNQLSNRHLIFQKLLLTDRASKHISLAALQLRMNKIDSKMEQFMKSAERDSHKFKRNNIEWSPITRVWLRQRWLLQRVQKFKAGRIRDPRNLFCECARRGIKDPRQITPDEIVAEFYVCKRNTVHSSDSGS